MMGSIQLTLFDNAKESGEYVVQVARPKFTTESSREAFLKSKHSTNVEIEYAVPIESHITNFVCVLIVRLMQAVNLEFSSLR